MKRTLIASLAVAAAVVLIAAGNLFLMKRRTMIA